MFLIAPKVIKKIGFSKFGNPNILNLSNGEGHREEHIDKHGVAFCFVSGSGNRCLRGTGDAEEMGVGRNFHAIGVVGFVPIAIFLPAGIKEGFCCEPFHVDKWSDVGIRVPERQGVRYFQR